MVKRLIHVSAIDGRDIWVNPELVLWVEEQGFGKEQSRITFTNGQSLEVTESLAQLGAIMERE